MRRTQRELDTDKLMIMNQIMFGTSYEHELLFEGDKYALSERGRILILTPVRYQETNTFMADNFITEAFSAFL